jgi:hypothetical protein
MNYESQDPQTMTLGSDAWVEAVYKSGPSRSSEGRSRPTQRYFGAPNPGLEACVLEGRNEYVAYLLLCVLRNLKIVSRFKEQPFRLDKERHGVLAFPDFMFDLVDGRRYVLEVKSNRYIDEDEMKQMEAVNAAFKDTSITYLLWTDKWPLHRPVISATNHMRRAYQQDYPLVRLLAIRDAVQQQPKTLKELRNLSDGRHFDEVLAAAYRGLVFFNFFQSIDDQTQVFSEPDSRLLNVLLHTKVQGMHGWDAGARR